jgi:hypothetical protein
MRRAFLPPVFDDCEACVNLRSDYLNDAGELTPYWAETMAQEVSDIQTRRGYTRIVRRTLAEKAYIAAHPIQPTQEAPTL